MIDRRQFVINWVVFKNEGELRMYFCGSHRWSNYMAHARLYEKEATAKGVCTRLGGAGIERAGRI